MLFRSLDEIGRGTSTFDGMSIAWAVAEYLHDLDGKGVKTLFATHYHELTKLEQLKPRIKNFNIAVKEFNDNIIFLRRLVQGGTNKSYGIQVARLAGVPDAVINKAKQILAATEKAQGSQQEQPWSQPKGMNQQAKTGIKTRTRDRESAGQNNTDRSATRQQQMDLFARNDHDDIIKALEETDISTMTPIDALNFINDLKQKIRSKALI